MTASMIKGRLRAASLALGALVCVSAARGDVHAWYELVAFDGPGIGVVELEQGVRGGPLVITRDSATGVYEFVVRLVVDIDATSPIVGYSVDLLAPTSNAVSVEALTYLAAFDIPMAVQLGVGPGAIIAGAGQVSIFGTQQTGVVELFEFVLRVKAATVDDVVLSTGIGPDGWPAFGGAIDVFFADAGPLSGSVSGQVFSTPSIIIRAGTAPVGGVDCDGNGVVDSIEIGSDPTLDCDADGQLDVCAIADGTASDCNGNGVPDSCDVRDGTSADCNMDGVPDACDIADGRSGDCNDNGVPDECDIVLGHSADADGNGLPDECDVVDPPAGDPNAGAAGPGEVEVPGVRPGIRPQVESAVSAGPLVDRSLVRSVLSAIFDMSPENRQSLMVLPIRSFGVFGVPASLFLFGLELWGAPLQSFLSDLSFAILDTLLP